MTKILPLAASMMMLVAISGQALAGTTAPSKRHQPPVTNVSALSAFDSATVIAPNTHRYQGGPKSND